MIGKFYLLSFSGQANAFDQEIPTRFFPSIHGLLLASPGQRHWLCGPVLLASPGTGTGAPILQHDKELDHGER